MDARALSESAFPSPAAASCPRSVDRCAGVEYTDTAVEVAITAPNTGKKRFEMAKSPDRALET